MASICSKWKNFGCLKEHRTFSFPLKTTPYFPLERRFPIHTAVQGGGGGEGSDLLTPTIGRAIGGEEYGKGRGQKSIRLDGYSIEGRSIAGHETCVILPELKAAFDIGRFPRRAMQQNSLFITHAHLDHIAGLPLYIATRGLYSLKPPTIVVPPSIKEDVEQLINVHRTMGKTELNYNLVALDVGETYEMKNNLLVRPFRTHHVITSQGYVIYSVRKKLKKQYKNILERQIKELKKSGVEITETILCPEVAFTGDTTSDFFHDPSNADALRAKILITEATFLDEIASVEHAREHGHTHLSEIMENVHQIQNNAVVLTHFSPRYYLEDIRLAVSKLQSMVSAKVIALTEGFKSMNT